MEAIFLQLVFPLDFSWCCSFPFQFFLQITHGLHIHVFFNAIVPLLLKYETRCFFQPCSLVQNYKTHRSIIIKQNTWFVTPLHQLLIHHQKKNAQDGKFLPWSFQLAICLKCKFFINNCIESSFINLELGML